ncbi:hypothetical protein SH1V18_45540 [Vallitalea longa]|uniref:Uncharacterized protein n=1 Tax=Vallitalea longa TaxID=2936439 RepID=A0A9W6DIM9_9FIRM|nr:hypothetical protein [Vallitalea longa]GKX32074.1 hypothetical protein SH1V18_45540 [Vallitalea longa]
MSKKNHNIILYIMIISLYILTCICLFLAEKGYTTIAELIFSILLISGSILGFVKKAIVFLPLRTSIKTNYYGNQDKFMHIFGYFMNGLTLLFGVYLLINILINNPSWSY